MVGGDHGGGAAGRTAERLARVAGGALAALVRRRLIRLGGTERKQLGWRAFAEVICGGRQNISLDSHVLVESFLESLELSLDRHCSVDLWLASRRVDC